MKRKVCVVITARPSYSRIKTALEAIKRHKDLELQLVVSTSALLERLGSTINYIEEDGFEIAAKVYNVIEGDNLTSMAKTTGLGMLELSNVFLNLSPDVVITVADRFETIATAIAAAYMNIPLVHVQGGEETGSIDDKVRHAITKLADFHFVSTHKAAEKVIGMGEDPECVYHTGCPSIDLAKEILYDPALDFDPIKKYGGVGNEIEFSDGYIVVMQHPVTTEYEVAKVQALETLNAIKDINMPAFWFWPNIDAGSDGTSKAIRTFRELENPEKIRFFKNMRSGDFLKLMYNCKCMVGNSSIGIRESSYLGVPVINIGTRQNNRERAGNVMDTGYNKNEIINAVRKQISNGKYEQSFIYGNGEAGVRIADLLGKIELLSDNDNSKKVGNKYAKNSIEA